MCTEPINSTLSISPEPSSHQYITTPDQEGGSGCSSALILQQQWFKSWYHVLEWVLDLKPIALCGFCMLTTCLHRFPPVGAGSDMPGCMRLALEPPHCTHSKHLCLTQSNHKDASDTSRDLLISAYCITASLSMSPRRNYLLAALLTSLATHYSIIWWSEWCSHCCCEFISFQITELYAASNDFPCQANTRVCFDYDWQDKASQRQFLARTFYS